ncbi:HP1 family phage holin [Ectopseudomonas alcaliphila]|uniref:Bacteriophage holin family HP1 n=2 Tax=Ectopseudomonas alcaliphila TaxID=101564 RepID=A0A1G7JHC2_9GAMM|nr:Bacteriophage holin family HP1 [Pseudomonas alcaliphila]
MSGDRIMNGVSYAGAGVSVVSGLTLTEWGIVVGIITALLTFAANIIYQHRRDRRERNLAELQERLIYRDVAREVEQ